MSQYQLIASKAAGSMIVESALALAKLPCEIEMIPYGEPGPQRDRLLALNPLGSVYNRGWEDSQTIGNLIQG